MLKAKLLKAQIFCVYWNKIKINLIRTKILNENY